MNIFISTLLIGYLVTCAYGQERVYKICDSKHRDACDQLQRGSSPVNCIYAQDSIECAKRLKNGTADFGIFSAESALQLSVLNWGDLTVVKELRNHERHTFGFDYQSVVVVKKDFTGGLDGLKNKKFCHPGLNYGKSQKWSERFLKYFERTVTKPVCDKAKTLAEIEVSALASTFSQACRPGKWSHDVNEDAALKKKYPQLCQLCSNGGTCDYQPDYQSGANIQNSHQQALNCLKTNGDVAYVSLDDSRAFFDKLGPGFSDSYQYLCPNGTLEPSSKAFPCVWLRQPWKMILSNSEKSISINKLLDSWLSSSNTANWKRNLDEILETDTFLLTPVTMQLPSEHIRMAREIPAVQPFCESEIKWCTTSNAEKEKCSVVAAGALTSGALPNINCQDPSENTVHCLEDINANKSDFIGIDSNFGYMARSIYNLTAAMYFETEKEQYSSIVVVIHKDSKYKKFEDLKGSKACLPEFGATASIAFINLGKERKFFKRNECRYEKLLHNFFGPTCAPGANDLRHDRFRTSPDSLCDLCMVAETRQSNSVGVEVEVGGTTSAPPGRITCSADETNRYYGNKGALKCLHEVGDVAILELQSLKDQAISLSLDPNQFQIICRNGSLANRPGFDVDSECPLTTIVDGEVVVRRGSTKVSNIVNTLSALDVYFQSDPDFKMYNIYDSKKHLLFKDSTIGLISAQEKNFGPSVEKYVKLFKNIEDCVQGGAGMKTILSISSTIFIALVASFWSR